MYINTVLMDVTMKEEIELVSLLQKLLTESFLFM